MQTCANWGDARCYVPDKPGDFLAVFLALAALIFAIKQYFDAQNAEITTSNLRDMTDSLTKEIFQLKENSSTRALPRFPENVPAVCKLLDGCPPDTSLLIMVDHIGYSLYSDQDHFDRYLKCLQEAIKRGVRIRLLAYGYGRAKNAIRKQFPEISAERAKPRFANFFRRLGKTPATNEKEFYRAMLLAEEDLFPKINGVEMRLLLEDPPAFFWMKDNPYQIVFGFRDEFPGTGFSFQSENHDLCDQFKVMFNTEWARAEDHWDCRGRATQIASLLARPHGFGRCC